MEKAIKKDIESKYKIILSQESSWARAVVSLLIEPKPFTVWEFLIPVILIMNFAQSKTRKEIFIQNLLFTKKLALNTAQDMLDDELTKEVAMIPVEKKTREILESDQQGLYSEEIRQKQLIEISLLADHFNRLLRAEGEDFFSLVRYVYPDRNDYVVFLTGLQDAEKEVNLTSIQTLGDRANPEFVSRMEQAAHQVRMSIVEKIYCE